MTRLNTSFQVFDSGVRSCSRDSGEVLNSPHQNEIQVSVILLAYNHEQFIEECVRSVLSQEGVVFEVIAIDNGSSDESPRILSAAFEDSKVKSTVVLNQQNLGIGRALNLALLHSSGDFIVALACDDVMLPGRLNFHLQVLQRCGSNVAGVAGDARLIDEQSLSLRDADGREYLMQSLIPRWLPEARIALIRSCCVIAPACMLRRESILEAGGFSETMFGEDYDLWIRLVFRLERSIVAIPGLVAGYRRHGSNASASHEALRYRLETLELIGHFELSKEERRELAASKRSAFHPLATSRLHDWALERGGVSRRDVLAISLDHRASVRLRLKACLFMLSRRLGEVFMRRRHPESLDASRLTVSRANLTVQELGAVVSEMNEPTR